MKNGFIRFVTNEPFRLRSETCPLKRRQLGLGLEGFSGKSPLGCCGNFYPRVLNAIRIKDANC